MYTGTQLLGWTQSCDKDSCPVVEGGEHAALGCELAPSPCQWD